MIYRTAHRATYRSLNNNLNTLSYRIAQLTNQIASERRINTPSDDPSGSATVLSTRSNLSAIKQYSSNIAVSDLWLADSGTAIQSMKETLDQMKSVLAMQGSTDTYSETQRSEIMAEQVSELFQSLIQFGNTKIGGSGSYIFGGQQVTTQPFSLKVEAQKVIAGCQNSDKWTGKVVNYGDPTFNNRPDLPVQSQDFLIEVVKAGGVASQYYTNSSGEPYTLAQATIDPKGTQNGLVWSIKNKSGFEGELGNNFSVAYVVQQNPFSTNPDPPIDVKYNAATGINEITVNLAASASIYNQAFAQVYNDPQSGAYRDMDKANEMALKEAVLTTGNEVRSMVQNCDELLQDGSGKKLNEVMDINLADGNSGLGKVNVAPRTQLSEGYTGYALFRVSQDGGKTWGPAMDFSASEYKNGDMFYNAALGHASFTTSLPGKANDLVFTATQMGSWGNDLRVEYKLPDDPNDPVPSVSVGPNPWNICVNLETDSQGNVVTTAKEIMDLINNDPTASQLLTADLASYHEGGSGAVKLMECTALSVGEPYQVDGVTHITPLGYATGTVSFNYTAPGCPNISFQALEQGDAGNDIGIRYTTSADPTYYSDPAEANESYQDTTTIRYETTADGKTVMVVHLATAPLPDPCPDENEDREASEAWKKEFPVYSCTSARAVIATAGTVVEAIIDKNTQDPDSAIIWPSLERWTENGSSSTAKVGPTDGTIWLTGGNDTEDAGNHGVNLRFIMDGTALQVGDIFEVPVGYYRGDDNNIDINANANYRTTMNTSGDKVLGANGADDNILDTVQRLIYALEKNDSELVAKELETLDAGISKLLTLETQIGSRQIRNEFIQQNLDQAKYSSETLLSTVEDADFAQLITDLKNAQTVYEAVLGATGLTSKISLLNYI